MCWEYKTTTLDMIFIPVFLHTQKICFTQNHIDKFLHKMKWWDFLCSLPFCFWYFLPCQYLHFTVFHIYVLWPQSKQICFDERDWSSYLNRQKCTIPLHMFRFQYLVILSNIVWLHGRYQQIWCHLPQICCKNIFQSTYLFAHAHKPHHISYCTKQSIYWCL